MTDCSQPSICSDWSVKAVAIVKEFEWLSLFTGTPQIIKCLNMYHPMFAFCFPHTMSIFLIVKQALLTSGYNLEYSPFPTMLFPLKKSFYIFFALYLSALTIHNSFSCMSGNFSHIHWNHFSFLPLQNKIIIMVMKPRVMAVIHLNKENKISSTSEICRYIQESIQNSYQFPFHSLILHYHQRYRKQKTYLKFVVLI